MGLINIKIQYVQGKVAFWMMGDVLWDVIHRELRQRGA